MTLSDILKANILNRTTLTLKLKYISRLTQMGLGCVLVMLSVICFVDLYLGPVLYGRSRIVEPVLEYVVAGFNGI